MPTTTDDYLKRADLRIERRFDAPPARIFRAWTDPDEASRWMWGSLENEGWAEIDLRVGGAYRVYTRFDGGRHQGAGWSGMCGVYVAIEPDRKLVYTLHWDADVVYNAPDRLTLDEVVVVTFAADGDGTRMDYRHLGIPDDGMSAPEHRKAIEHTFDALAAMVAESSG